MLQDKHELLRTLGTVVSVYVITDEVIKTRALRQIDLAQLGHLRAPGRGQRSIQSANGACEACQLVERPACWQSACKAEQACCLTDQLHTLQLASWAVCSPETSQLSRRSTCSFGKPEAQASGSMDLMPVFCRLSVTRPGRS